MVDLSFLEQDSPVAAVALLGAVVTSTVDGERVSVLLNEVEAYLGPDDPASHAFRARTARNEPMFGLAGTIYVYRSYGIHWCINIVTGLRNDPQAVLLRGADVIEGTDVAIERRRRTDHLADGPGKLGQALGVTGAVSGTRLGAGPVALVSCADTLPPYEATPRVGVGAAHNRRWRFVTKKGTKHRAPNTG